MEIEKDAAKNFTKGYEVNGSISFNLHVGADSADDNKIAVKIESMSAKGIGVYGLKVDTEDDATAAIDRIAEAVQKVSSQRSTLGAAQNRLEHTIANLDNVVENTTSAESRIRDTDMAQEMVKKWLITARTIFLLRQVSLCLHRLISLTRVFFHFSSNQHYLINTI